MTCLDTDFIVSLLRENKDALRKFEELEKVQAIMTVSSITAAELVKGAYNSMDPDKEISRVMEYLESLYVLDFDFQCAKTFGRIWNDLKKRGKMINEFDILLASTIINNDEVLLTKNIKHFEKIPELKIKSW